METNQIKAAEREETQIDLLELFYVLLHRLWMILLAAVICAAGAYVGTKELVTPQYTSTSMLYMVSKGVSITSVADIQLGSQLTPDYMVLIKSRPVLETVIENLDLPVSYERLAGMITLTNSDETRFIRVTVTNANPETAKQIADEVAEVAVSKVAELMKVDEPSIIEKGQVATAPSSPNVRKNCMMGALLGAVVVAAILILLYILNDTIATQEDVEKYLGLNTLGTIPLEDGERKTKRKRWKKRARKIKR